MTCNPRKGGASAPLDLAWSVEVRERASKIVDDFNDRVGEGEQQLAAPGCDRHCPVCVRECAVRAISAAWWAGQLAADLAAEGELLSHSGRIYAEPMGRA